MQTSLQKPRTALVGEPAEIAEQISRRIDAIQLPANELNADHFPDSLSELNGSGYYGASLTLSGPAPDRYAEHHFGERVYVEVRKRTTEPAPTVTVSARERFAGEILNEIGTPVAQEIAVAIWSKLSQLQQQERDALTALGEELPSVLNALTAEGMIPGRYENGSAVKSRWQEGDLTDPRGRPILYSFDEGLAQPDHERLDVLFFKLNSIALGPSQNVFHFLRSGSGNSMDDAETIEYLTGRIGEFRFQCEQSADQGGPTQNQPSARVWFAEGSERGKFGIAVPLSTEAAQQIFELTR